MDLPTILTPLLLGISTQFALHPIPEVPTLPVLSSWILFDIVFLIYNLLHLTIPTAVLSLIQFNALYFISLLLTCAFHRLYLNPLRAFPGHRLSALTKLHETHLNLQGRQCFVLESLHAQHGDFIRIGPNELSIRNVDALKLLLRQPYNNRGPFYLIGKAGGSDHLSVTRSNAKHLKWRRIWDKAFGRVALEEYNPRVEWHARKLIRKLEEIAGGEVDIRGPVEGFAFDIMADLAFGVPNYGIQDGTGDPSIISFAHDFVRIVAAVAPLRNICQIASLLPIPAGVQRFRLKQHEMINARLSLGTSRTDIFAHLIGEDTESGERFTRDQLTSNAELVIVAGTDTTATVLTELFRELAIRREVQRKLYEEIVEKVGEEVELDVNNVKTMPYLQAVIDEIMRLWTPLPSGLQHQTGPDGAWVDGVFVPPNTAFRVPHMALMKDERYFPRGREFWPERWIEEGGVKEPKAFVPFSYGAHKCVGMQLALNELRLATASVVRKFDIQLGDSYNEEDYSQGWKDYFLVALPEVKLKFVPRK